MEGFISFFSSFRENTVSIFSTSPLLKCVLKVLRSHNLLHLDKPGTMPARSARPAHSEIPRINTKDAATRRTLVFILLVLRIFVVKTANICFLFVIKVENKLIEQLNTTIYDGIQRFYR